MDINDWENVIQYMKNPKPKIIGFFGRMGTGKTMLMTFFALMFNEQGHKIYSNYHLNNIDYTPISTLDDLEKMHDGIFLGDELWLWVMARSSMSKLNKDLMKIVFLNRKRNMTILYTAQLYRQIDVLLREVTDIVFHPRITNDYTDPRTNEKLYRLSFYWQDPYTGLFHPCDCNGRPSGEIYLNQPLSYYGQFYDTNQEIKNLDGSKASPLTKGINLENKFVKALEKLKFVNYVDLLPNSGMNSHWKYDVIAYTNKGILCFDVKGSCKDRIYLDEFGNILKNKIYNAYKHNAIPYLAFPDPERQQLTNPKFWHIYRLNKESYLLGLNSRPSYPKLSNQSILLPDLTI